MTGYRLILPNNTNNDETNVTIKGIIFDMDGTLTKPQTWMFGEMRNQLNVPNGIDILTHLDSLPTIKDKEEAELKLRLIEEKAMIEQEPTIGLFETLQKLNKLDIKTSICTRNVPKPVSKFCSKFLNYDPFSDENGNGNSILTGPIVTREFKPPKPSAKPLLHIINSWNVKPNEVIMVGDSNDDIDAGLNAGCAVILLRHDDNYHVEKSYNFENNNKLDAIVTDLNELYNVLENGLYVKSRESI